MNLNLDSQHNPKPLTLVLAKKDGTKLGTLPAHHLKVNAEFNSMWTMEFSVYKTNNGKRLEIWDKIVDFKLLWVKEFDLWFEIHVQTGDGNVCIKNITAKSLAQAELAQTKIYGIEINTEIDIKRDDYSPTVFYDSTDESCSLLNRVLNKTPHYSIKSVPISLRNIQRIFSFNGSTVYEALSEIAEEIGCYFDYAIHSDENGKPNRTITVYDLNSYCLICKKRGEFKDVCEECGSEDVVNGYGDDTNIFVSTHNLTDEVSFETNEDSVKNCFKLESGDDLMDATIINCNPNGSGYLWHIPSFMKKDMPNKLVEKIESYDELFEYYQNSHTVMPSSTLTTSYNSLVSKYKTYKSDLSNLKTSIVGFPALMNEYYNTIDFKLLLQSSLMPSAETMETSALEQASRLTATRISPVAVYSLTSASSSTVDSAVLAMAKAQVDYRYQVKIISSSYSDQTWRGSFVVTNYYDEKDTASSSVILVNIVENYEDYVSQMLDKSLSNTTDYAIDIVTLFDMGDEQFKSELKKYSLARLNAFYKSCEACLNILIERSAANRETWSSSDDNLYDNLYLPYRNKHSYIQEEISLRESEIALIGSVQSEINTFRGQIQDALNFEKYLGTDLWLMFIAYRREDTYSNSNYISDGLDNAELFNRAMDFIEVAKKELYKSANLQHSLTSTLKNLLVMKEFDGLTDKFELGNFIHVQCDESVYDVRLLSFSIDFDNLDDLSVTFSDVREDGTDIDDIDDVIGNLKSIVSSYDNVAHQAQQGNNSRKQLDDWTTNGLALTALKIINSADNQDYVFDEHGMLFRKYMPLSGTYGDEQLKIINSTIAITNDNWITVKTAVGSHYYIDPLTNELTYAYGINGETLIGKIILGEQLGIYNSGATLQFNKNGLIVTNDVTTFMLNPNTTDNILSIQVNNEDVLRVSKDGLYITGEVVATSGEIGGLKITNNKLQIGLSDVTNLSSAINEVERETKAYADGAVSSLRDTLEANYETKDVVSKAINEIQRSAEVYADKAVSSLRETIEADYSTNESLSEAISQVELNAKSYADGAVVELRETLEANYETKDVVSKAINEVERKVISDVNETLSYFQNNISATYSTKEALNSAMSNIEQEAKAYADGAIAKLKLTTSVNGNTASISMQATDSEGSTIDISADKITFGIPEKVSDLENDSGYQTPTGVVAIIEGKITADFVEGLDCEFDKGKIGGWAIDGTSLKSTNTNGCCGLYSGNTSQLLQYKKKSLLNTEGVSYSYVRFYAGASSNSNLGSSMFAVLDDGSLYANAAQITGTISGSLIEGSDVRTTSDHYTARLWNGAECYDNLLALLQKSTLDNLLDNHPPFQIDGNFGATAGIAEMLLQSREDRTILLPALPKEWPEGSVTGLCGVGAIAYHICWKDNTLSEVTLQAQADTAVTLVYRGVSRQVSLSAGTTTKLSISDF